MGNRTPSARSQGDGPSGSCKARQSAEGRVARAALALSAYYRAILEHSPTAIITLDRSGVILEASTAASQLISLPAQRLVGTPLRELMGAEARPLLDRALGGERVNYEGFGCLVPPEGEHWLRAKWVPVCDDSRTFLGGLVLIEDASAEKKAQDLVEKLAFLDPVTELPNRAMLARVLTRALSGEKASQRQLALVWLNLDRFKDVNDALGQQVGDELLRAVGGRLHEQLRSNDMVAHIGADDFVLLLPRITAAQHIERVMNRINDVFGAPFAVGDEAIVLTASCGVALHPGGASDARQLQDHAHSAMRAAKELGGGSWEIFASRGAKEGSTRLWLAREIRDSIAQGHFTLHYQPLVDLAHDARPGSRSAGALAAPEARPARTGGVHPLRRGERPDHLAGGAPAGPGVRPAAQLAEGFGLTTPPGDQHLGPRGAALRRR